MKALKKIRLNTPTATHHVRSNKNSIILKSFKHFTLLSMQIEDDRRPPKEIHILKLKKFFLA